MVRGQVNTDKWIAPCEANKMPEPAAASAASGKEACPVERCGIWGCKRNHQFNTYIIAHPEDI